MPSLYHLRQLHHRQELCFLNFAFILDLVLFPSEHRRLPKDWDIRETGLSKFSVEGKAAQMAFHESTKRKKKVSPVFSIFVPRDIGCSTAVENTRCFSEVAGLNPAVLGFSFLTIRKTKFRQFFIHVYQLLIFLPLGTVVEL